jgi:hypothetical protein
MTRSAATTHTSRPFPWLSLSLTAVILSLLPCVMLPDVSGPTYTPEGIRQVDWVVRALLLPPERFREQVLGQFGTFASINSGGTVKLWWLRPPVYTRMAIRHYPACNRRHSAFPFGWQYSRHSRRSCGGFVAEITPGSLRETLNHHPRPVPPNPSLQRTRFARR